MVRAEPSKMKAGIENEVPQRQIETELDMPITQEEITKAIAAYVFTLVRIPSGTTFRSETPVLARIQRPERREIT